MDALTILAIAVGLAMDAFSVSIAYGIKAKSRNTNNALAMASSFGAFQAFMPVLGWFAGVKMLDFIAGFDHWLAFALLLLIGCKMIYESTKPDAQRKAKPLNVYVLLVLSIATSIDALAVGLSFAFLKVSIITPIIIIGTVTFTLSFVGTVLGDKLSRFKPDQIEILGGLILIAIGAKILIEHLTLV
ncbi:MAG: manganese efflux pump MntP family protein [Candidatus Bathyarchaeales archaeon]